MSAQAEYELHYWSKIPGRGEFPRLAFEDSGVAYRDVARETGEGGGTEPMMALLRGENGRFQPFAPPILVHHTESGDVVLSQSAVILHYLGARLGLAPTDEVRRTHAHILQLTLADFVDDIHNTHHPVSPHLTYEEQAAEAARAAAMFVKERMGKYLRYFESVLSRGDGKHLVGDAHSYVDLSAFHVLEGLEYAFPRALGRVAPELSLLFALRDRVRQRPRIKAYLESPRRIPFSQGIFRKYAELDD